MRRAVLATTGISSLVVLLLTLKPHQLPATSGAAPRSSTPSTPSSSGTSTGTASGTATGTFTGDPVDTQYGTVQVAVTLAKGKLTAVKVLQAPDQNGRDQQIASYSLPRLTQEAIGAQSAHIDAVSGASYTSQGYIQSLQSALDQARA
ncbi:FMN-binding protein [Streptomyces sp. NPDC048243]|uniref:FMN-binding protein n=1 Tax=Streptomyces sp. NPDC048243 TaxID=3365522 RepID=UPI00371A6B2D